MIYQLSGGTLLEELPLFYPAEDGLAQLPLPVCEGHNFVGWYADVEKTVLVEQIPAGTWGKQTLYAKWEANGEGFCRDQTGDGDHACDICGAEAITVCEDAEQNHLCDECSVEIGIHAAALGSHVCSYCGQAASACADGDDTDTLCDICGKDLLQIHVQENQLTVENKASVWLMIAEYEASGRMVRVWIVTERAELLLQNQTRIFILSNENLPQLPYLEPQTSAAVVR
jgi:uncharacterized repeat protein (TIGR02543 family)